LLDKNELPGRVPKAGVHRRQAETLEREGMKCILCDSAGTIELREVGFSSILVCKNCGSVFEPTFHAFKNEIWILKINSVGEGLDLGHMVKKEIRFPIDEKLLKEEKSLALPGEPPTLKRAKKEEAFVRENMENCILCGSKGSLKMRTESRSHFFFCINCHSRSQIRTNFKVTKIKSVKVLSIGSSGVPSTWVGRKYHSPIDMDEINEDLNFNLPGQPPEFEHNKKFDRFCRSVIPICVVCFDKGSLRLREVNGKRTLVCRTCHSKIHAIPNLKGNKILFLKVESTGRVNRRELEGRSWKISELSQNERWKEGNYPPVHKVEGSTHGSHWWTVLGERDLMDLFEEQRGKKVGLVSDHYWIGKNIQHKKVLDNHLVGMVTDHEDVKIMHILMNNFSWTAYPRADYATVVDAVIDKVSLWPNMIEGWLHFNIKSGTDNAYLSAFDPYFFIHKGKIDKNIELALIGFAYEYGIGKNREFENERTRENKDLFPKGKAFITDDSGWFMPLGFMQKNPNLNPDDHSIRMKVEEREEINLFGEQGYLFSGKPFGKGSDFILKVVSRKLKNEDETPDVGDSLVASIWLQAVPAQVSINGINSKLYSPESEKGP
jgi:hypothetical protein